MQGRRWWYVGLIVVAAVALGIAACGGDDDEGGEAGGELDRVTVQLKWVTQAQFAGYYAAKELGYYEDEGLDVTIRPGGPDIVPEQPVLGNQAEFGINWQDNLLKTRDEGGELVNIAQVFTRSGMTEITWADTGLDSIAKLRGKKVGVWLAGNEHKLFAALEKNGIDPQREVEIVNQPFTMDLFLNREVDAAAAMTYNELAQVLAAENEETGEQVQLDDLNVIKFEDIGIGALEDGLFVREDWIESEENQDLAKRFLKATFRGWIHCRDNADECVEFVLESGSTLGEDHQRWMMNEVNALIWPAPRGIGVMDPEAFQRTVDIVSEFDVVKTRPNATDAYRTDIADAAIEELEQDGVDVGGAEWEKEELEVAPAGG